MTHPFSVFAGALTTVDCALKLYHQVSTFIAKATNADKTAKALAAKAQGLQRMLFMVRLALRVRKAQFQNGNPVVEETYICKNIHETLRDCVRTLRRFKKEVGRLHKNPGDQGMSGTDKTLWQWRYDRRNPIIQNLQNEITDHTSVLSVSLQCLHL